ncbi:hypothetical protein ACLOJK_029142 [Asimina triloba]
MGRDAVPFMTADIEDVIGKSFDYIIVGRGTSGCPLAATLSQNSKVLGTVGGTWWVAIRQPVDRREE